MVPFLFSLIVSASKVVILGAASVLEAFLSVHFLVLSHDFRFLKSGDPWGGLSTVVHEGHFGIEAADVGDANLWRFVETFVTGHADVTLHCESAGGGGVITGEDHGGGCSLL